MGLFLRIFFSIISFASHLFFKYRISANSFRGNYSFLNLALCTVTLDLYFINLNSCRGNYSREETIQRRKLFAEIRYVNIVGSSASSFGHSDPDPSSVR